MNTMFEQLNKYKELNFKERENIKKDFKNINIERGEIWWVNLGNTNIMGSEQRDIRPCIAIHNKVAGQYSPVIIVAIITSQLTKRKLPTHVHIGEESGLKKPSMVLLEQIRTIDKERLISKVGTAEKSIMNKIDKAIEISISVGKGKENFMSKEEKKIITMCEDIRNIEITLWNMYKYKIKDSDSFNKMICDREYKLNELQAYCEYYKLDYNDYYETYKSEDEIIQLDKNILCINSDINEVLQTKLNKLEELKNSIHRMELYNCKENYYKICLQEFEISKKDIIFFCKQNNINYNFIQQEKQKIAM